MAYEPGTVGSARAARTWLEAREADPLPVGYFHAVFSRLLRFDAEGVTFRYKNYREVGAARQQVMALATDEFIRRFRLHALPRGFHRIRHHGLLASARRKAHLERARACSASRLCI